MEKKLKVALSMLGVILILIIGLVAYNFRITPSEVVTKNENTKAIEKNQPVSPTAPVVTGDKETDASIDATIDEVLSEEDINSEIEDIDITLSQEEEVDQINNLFNENEL